MRPAFRFASGLAGAAVFGALAGLWLSQADPPYEARALAVVEAGAGPAQVDLAAARSLAASEPVLRRVTLDPRSAAIVERAARASLGERAIGLLGFGAPAADTLSRAAALLAPRLDARAGPLPETIEIVARMEQAADAAIVATAAAEAFVAEINDLSDAMRKRGAEARRARLDRASARVEQAQARVQALRMTDPAPTGSLQNALPGREDAAAVERLQRAAGDAAARLAQSARVLGPRHPQLIEQENEARNARAALDKARERQRFAQAAAPAANGGPDPRAAELAAAEQEATRAEAAYDLEQARGAGAERREARLVRPAATPARASRPSPAVVLTGASLLGFLLLGLAPGLPPLRGRGPRANDRLLGRLGGDGLDEATARRTLQALEIAATETACRIAVAGDDGGQASRCAAALVEASLAAGWRPLLVEPRARDAGAPDLWIAIDGRLHAARRRRTRDGVLYVAAPAERAPARAMADVVDAALAFDLIVSSLDLRADCILRVGRSLSDRAAGKLARSARYVGTILAN